MSDESWKHELIALSPSQLHVGDALRFTLRDETGRILLAKGLRVEDQKALEQLQRRRAVYVEYEESDEAVKVLMGGLSEASRRDAPLKDLDRFMSLKAADKDTEQVALDQGSAPQTWSEIESRLRVQLSNLSLGGQAATEAVPRLDSQVIQPIDALLNRDREAALFLLIHRAVTSFKGYSALHSLLTAVVVHTLSGPLKLSPEEDRALLRAALTMNVAMTNLQDALAQQKHRPTPPQQAQIDRHALEGAKLMQAAGVKDPMWLGTVLKHHQEFTGDLPLAQRPVIDRLARILQVVDRYTAAMSPRVSRAGRDAKDAARSAIVQPGAGSHDEVGLALMMQLGLHPAGTFVKLASGETAVVLRKGAKPNEPHVATVLNKRDEPIAEPRLIHTAKPDHAVVHGVSGSLIRVRLNQELMLRQLASSRTGTGRGLGLF